MAEAQSEARLVRHFVKVEHKVSFFAVLIDIFCHLWYIFIPERLDIFVNCKVLSSLEKSVVLMGQESSNQGIQSFPDEPKKYSSPSDFVYLKEYIFSP